MKNIYLVMLSLLILSCSTSDKVGKTSDSPTTVPSSQVILEKSGGGSTKNTQPPTVDPNPLEVLLNKSVEEAIAKIQAEARLSSMKKYVATRSFQTGNSKQMISTNIYISEPSQKPSQNRQLDDTYAMIIVSVDGTTVESRVHFGRLVIYDPYNFNLKTSSGQEKQNTSWSAYSFDPRKGYTKNTKNGSTDWKSYQPTVETLLAKETSNKLELITITICRDQSCHSKNSRSFTAKLTGSDTALDSNNSSYSVYNKVN